ncbi:MAG: hypothetical protein U1E29_16920 [Coriobacteriia bacterium]|nr:hypothetical protein [Coriobacteriia bacterium]
MAATIALLIAVVAAAWLMDIAAHRGDAATEYEVIVASGDETLCVMDMERIRTLETRRVAMQGQLQEGPSLLALLADCGIEEFESVTVTGMGIRDDGHIELAAEEIDEDVLLDIAVRGTLKLCGPHIAWEDRVRDVQRIDVRR